jgi:hypothetical protein
MHAVETNVFGVSLASRQVEATSVPAVNLHLCHVGQPIIGRVLSASRTSHSAMMPQRSEAPHENMCSATSQGSSYARLRRALDNSSVMKALAAAAELMGLRVEDVDLAAGLIRVEQTITHDRYGHLMPRNEDEAAALLDAYLERANTKARLAQLQAP